MSTSVDLKRVMANKTDEELYDVLHGHSDDYTGDAIDAAKQEFASRNLTAPTLSTLSAAVEAQKRGDEAPLVSYANSPRRIGAFWPVSAAFILAIAQMTSSDTCDDCHHESNHSR
jgi:hypothetical protein